MEEELVLDIREDKETRGKGEPNSEKVAPNKEEKKNKYVTL